MEPLVCVILVNYNGVSDTEECVKSLKECNYTNLHIVIVDNGSLTGKVEYNEIITKDKCEIIYSKDNVGFAGANNIGINRALEINADYVLILNNDTVVHKDFLFPLIDACKENPKIGIATGKIYYFDEPEYLWFGGSYYDESLSECKIDGIGKKDSEEYSAEKYIPFATGCLWLIPKNVLSTVGLMSEEYFLYYEDADYCERLKNKGYSIKYIPSSVIYHKESRSTKKGSPLYHYYITRNYLYYIRKYVKGSRKYKMYFNRGLQTLRSVVRKRMKFYVAYRAFLDFMLCHMGKENILKENCTNAQN
ncbi:MAG: glycosyltransferase family 2 protein [Oscillospiraceae bacterium]|nr:glycosyltransferase family 2 protein [Oscillospiraceae bacterium]